MSYPNLVAVTNAFPPAQLSSPLPNAEQIGQEFSLNNALWSEVDANGVPNGVPLGQSGPFLVQINSEEILCASFQAGICVVFDDDGTVGRAYNSTSIAVHSPGTSVTLKATSCQSQSGGTSAVQIIDLGLVNLVDAVMNGPTTLYEMPEGSFLASIRFTDDPDTVPLDVNILGANDTSVVGVVIGTVKSFGWAGFGWVGAPTATYVSIDTTATAATVHGYGPFAALDTGIATDQRSTVLSAASVGPIQIGLGVNGGSNATEGVGVGVRVAAITPWVAATNYDSPESNTPATPGVLQKCAILENGTIWINDGLTGTSGGSTPDFAGNAGGSVTDGANIVWYDTTSPPPTVGAVHVVAEIWTPVSP